MVKDGTFSYKLDDDELFKEILILEGHQNCFSGSKVTAILVNGGDFT